MGNITIGGISYELNTRPEEASVESWRVIM